MHGHRSISPSLDTITKWPSGRVGGEGSLGPQGMDPKCPSYNLALILLLTLKWNKLTV